MCKYLGRLLGQVKASNRGATLVYFALLLSMIAGFAGLGFDATLWFMEKRQLQNTADAAAMAAAYSKSRDGANADMTVAATADAAHNNFTVGGYNTILVENPPTSGKYIGQGNYVMVTTSMHSGGMFSSVLGVDEPTIKTVATAGILAVGEHCILALSDTRSKAVELSGNANITLDCGIASNSNSSDSIYVNGNVTVTADPSLQSYGDIYEGGNATLNTPNPIQPFSQKTVDPFASLEVPTSPVACTVTNYTFPSNAAGRAADPYYDLATDTFTFPPGRYCGGMDMSINSGTSGKIVLQPGEFIIDEGNFKVGSQASITGNGVSIILTATLAANIGSIDVTGGPGLDLTAPTSAAYVGATPADDYTGVLFYQDRRAPFTNNGNKITGNASMVLNGAIYIPSSELVFLGSSGLAGGCTQFIGEKVTLSGTVDTNIINDDAKCAALGIKDILSRTLVTLVE